MVLVAHPSAPAKTVAELIAYAKANPGKVTMASFGTGSASHLAGELFKMMAGVNMVHVPYRGGAPMMTDLVGGQVQVGFDVMVTSLPHDPHRRVAGARRGGQKSIRQAAGRADHRRDGSGIRGTGHGPASACRKARRRTSSLASTARSAPGLATPTITARLGEVGTDPDDPDRRGVRCLYRAESEKWAQVVKFAGIKAE